MAFNGRILFVSFYWNAMANNFSRSRLGKACSWGRKIVVALFTFPNFRLLLSHILWYNDNYAQINDNTGNSLTRVDKNSLSLRDHKSTRVRWETRARC